MRPGLMTTLRGIGRFANASLTSSISIHDVKSVLSLTRGIVTQELDWIVIYLVIRFAEHGLEAHSFVFLRSLQKSGGWHGSLETLGDGPALKWHYES